MIAMRRRISFILVAGLLFASLAMLMGGGAGAQITLPIGDLTPIDRPGPDIPINTQPPADGGTGIVPIVPPTPTPIPVNPNQPTPNIPQPDAPTPTLTPIFPVETVVTYIPPKFTPPDIPIVPGGTVEPTVPPTPTATVVAGFGNLTIHSRTCKSPWLNPSSTGSLAEMLAECPKSDREFEFTLRNSPAAYSKTVSTTGGTIIETVPSPYISMQRASVAGYDLSALSCGNDPFNKDYPKSIAHYAATDIAPGASVTCYWFNVIASTNVGISFDALSCPAVPPLTTPSVTPTDSDLTCTWPPLSGLTYTLADTNPSTPDKVATSHPDPVTHYGVRFVDLPPGKYTITLTPPTGATHAYVPQCSTGFGGPSTLTPVVVTGSGFTFTVTADAPGESYHCRWYIVKP